MATATRPAPAAPRPLPEHVQPRRALDDSRAGERPRRDRDNWWGAASAVTALVAAGALFPRPALVVADGGAALAGATLERPLSYTVLAPFTTTLDALALLSVRQHLAVIIGALLCYAGWRTSRRLRGRTVRGALGEGALGVLCFAAIAGTYMVGCLVPRPMAALAVGDPDVVRVDFHAHTSASHDGRRFFDAGRVREWHRSGGFDVAYVTDHGVWSGAAAGERGNPPLAGEGTVLLSAVEAWSGGEHLNVLGATAADSAFLRTDEEIDDAAIERAVAAGRRDPVLIGTLPGVLATLERGAAGGFPGLALGRVRALEIADAAPRGLEQSDSTRQRVLDVADVLDLAVVAGSDNHGWGRTAAAWSLVTIPGWRTLTPDSLGRAIESRIRDDGRGAVRVVERDRPRTIRGATMLLNGPVVLWHLFAALSPAERLAWLAWVWTLTLAWRAVRRRRSLPTPVLVVHHQRDFVPLPLPAE